ncbi:unnamed protein product [Meganyctiphanes norvegica]|uniref:BHLH domain-containing protein n=1 Tax=Meganyctiphanes norvegica TaxID=48144 RepID=A0AAV2PKX5_MEGNR
MALLASTEMLPESWMSSPTQIQSHALPEDIWSKFDIDHDRALVLANPAAMETNSSLPFGSTDIGPFSSPPHQGGYIGGVGVTTLPTPPRSPPTEHDLDDLVASIPEILESPSASPPSDISDIISDLETSTMDQSMEANSNWINLWSPLNTPITLPTQQSLKADIMWGGGHCCAPALEPAAKKRTISECSVDRALANVLKPDNDLSDSDDDDNLPDTPSGTDSDGDDHMSDTSLVTSPRSSIGSTNSPTHYSSPSHNYNHSHHHHHSHHQYRIGSSNTTTTTTTTPMETVIVNSEHNYCGRVPEINPQHLGGNITPSDTEDEVDVVGDHHIPILTSTPMVTSTTSTHLTTPSKRSEDVKRKLQLAINESRLKRQNKAAETSSPVVSSTIDSSRFVSVKIKTQGKPASYTKRMRDYHSEQVLKSTKNSSSSRRRNRGESDEGRRSVHNSLERQRRVDLRNAFETLRLLVPDTKVLDKAPKVQILKKAAFHCKQLQIQEHRLMREKEKLKKQIEYLKQQRRICS